MTEEQKLAAPAEKTVEAILKARLPGISGVQRVPQGVSTYVYRACWEGGICYARFLPEDATFGVEVLTHRKLLAAGVPVPEVLLYVPSEPVTGLSLMVDRELPGKALAEGPADDAAFSVLRQAGAALKRLHSIPVDGFGWVDRCCEDVLRGEHPTYRQYFTEFLEDDLAAMARCGFSAGEQAQTRRLCAEALEVLELSQAVLVHGDFCPDHIFRQDGRFTGFIDFGEIRGNSPYFDLGTFALNDETPSLAATAALLSGYGGADPRAVHLSAMAFALRFVGKKAGAPAAAFWRDRLAGQLRLLTEL